MTTAIKRQRSVGSVRAELLRKSRESALSAVKIFNDPTTKFKSESFIVLMVISWTYLMHAHYRSKGIEYRYFQRNGKRRRFERTSHGAYKYWELERCLNEKRSPIDPISSSNLKFLIGLRHEIEHQMTSNLDNYLSGRYQACILNYNEYLKRLFGKEHGLDEHLTYSLQFVKLMREQLENGDSADVPPNLRAYIARFDDGISSEQYDDPRYSFRLLFTKKLANRRGQADKVVEFVEANTELAKTIEAEYWVKKEVERPKFRGTEVCLAVQAKGFSRFRVTPEHSRLWKSEDARKPDKGYGVSVQGYWYWYKRWIDRCLSVCAEAGEKYR